MVDPILLLLPDDHDRPDVHHEGEHRDGEVGKEVEGVLRMVYLLCLGIIQYKLRASQINLNKFKINFA